jgi:hypothetical protein
MRYMFPNVGFACVRLTLRMPFASELLYCCDVTGLYMTESALLPLHLDTSG